jgi:hypothetical protein
VNHSVFANPKARKASTILHHRGAGLDSPGDSGQGNDGQPGSARISEVFRQSSRERLSMRPQSWTVGHRGRQRARYGIVHARHVEVGGVRVRAAVALNTSSKSRWNSRGGAPRPGTV